MSVEEYYDKLSSTYEELYAQEQARKHEIVLAIIKTNSFKIIVDIGCGPGDLLAKAERSCQFGIGVDISSRMLQRAKAALKGGRMDLVRASATLLPLRTGCGDCVVSISLLDSNKFDWKAQLSELQRIRKPPGILAVSVFHSDSGAPVAEELGLPSRASVQGLSRIETLYVSQLHADL